jgi:Mn2+/Fe2+ NRAMP family transporter
MLMEYEVHFYSSGAIEEDWKTSDLTENFAVAAFGCVLGGLLTIALVVVGAMIFLPKGIYPVLLSTTTLSGALPLGRTGLLLALAGTLACLTGAAIETAMAAGYNACQFYDLPWGKKLPPSKAPVFTALWAGTLVVGVVAVLAGVRPLTLVNLSVVFGMVLMPLTYYPILRTAMDKGVMGKHVNRKIDSVLGGVMLVLIVIAAVAAIPLMIVTRSGTP